MGKAKPSRFAFTEAKIKALPAPTAGRAWHYDTKAGGLCVCKTAAGSTSFYFYRRINGPPVRLLLGKWPNLTVEQARTAAKTKIGQIAEGRDPGEEHRARRQQPTLGNLFDHWMIYATAHKKPSSVAGDEWLWKRYLSEKWAAWRLASIKKTDVQAHHAAVGRDHGIYAANRMLSLLRAMYNKADELGYRGTNPAKGVKPFKEVSRDRFLQPHELAAFFRALQAEGPPFSHFFLLALLTGARRGNLQAMRWQDIDLAGGFWRIPESKAGMPVAVPLVDAALVVLRERHENADGSEWVFPGRRGGHMTEPKGAWKRIKEAAGIPDVRPHDLRRSLGSWMAGQNASLPIIGRALGHKSQQATMVYSRVAMDPLRDAVGKATDAMLAAGGQKQLEGPADE